jgi:hypothetical protein
MPRLRIGALAGWFGRVIGRGMVGGPFREGQGDKPTPWIVNGSMDSDRFLQIFTEVYNLWRQRREP